ncbi:MAG: AAA family ATPase [Tenericutes bacterium]|nr:AAA family ATPase [Mycoplasmatota bacterium]
MKKRNIIIIEGPQGVGKSTLANFLRDNLPSTNLYRLSGINDKTKTGKEKNEIMYLELIDYMKKLEKTELNMVFDRFFFSEQVYSKLGYKEYLFDDVYEKLLNKFYELNYNIYFVVLYLKNEKLYEKRLKRVHHNYKEFSLKSSVDQQKTYLELADNIDKSKVKVIKVAMDDYKDGYDKIIKDIPLLKESNIKYETI